MRAILAKTYATALPQQIESLVVCELKQAEKEEEKEVEEEEEEEEEEMFEFAHMCKSSEPASFWPPPRSPSRSSAASPCWPG